jgi:hypothetical protein
MLRIPAEFDCKMCNTEFNQVLIEVLALLFLGFVPLRFVGVCFMRTGIRVGCRGNRPRQVILTESGRGFET